MTTAEAPDYRDAAWRITADTLHGGSFSRFREAMIHETDDIRAFLANPVGTLRYISAPKGFGKTLVLIGKRLQMNEHSPEIFDGGEFIERLPDQAPSLSQDFIDRQGIKFEFWHGMWRYSIVVATLNQMNLYGRSHKSVKLPTDLDPLSQYFLETAELFHRPCDIFTRLMNEPQRRLAALDNYQKLSPYMQLLQSQVAFFIDNVDEYFTPVLEADTILEQLAYGNWAASNRGRARNVSNRVWVLAQLGLVVAAYELQHRFQHLKVFCTIRAEAYSCLSEVPAQSHSIHGQTLEIRYDRNDMISIFEKNVLLMSAGNPNRLFERSATGTLSSAFFGPLCTELQHKLVDRSEPALDFLLRHTFFRPRDLMQFCQKIANVSREQLTPDKMGEIVDQETETLVKTRLMEMSPFFRVPDLDILLRCVEKNVMTVDEIQDATDQFLESLGTHPAKNVGLEQIDDDYKDPFRILYSVGLLGWIETGNGQTDIQRFTKPSRVLIDIQKYASGRSLVDLKVTQGFYIIHPSLDAMIFARVNSVYHQNFHRACIIGYDLPWSPPIESFFVAKGDIFKFSELMQSEWYKPIALNLHESIKATCGDLFYAEVSGGDSVTLIDRSAVKLLKAIRDLVKRLKAKHIGNVSAKRKSDEVLDFRFGGSAGPIEFEKIERCLNGKWSEIEVPLGLALRASARLEPHAPVGGLIVDDEFMSLLEFLGQNRIGLEIVLSSDFPDIDFEPEIGKFHIRKSLTDPPLVTSLFKMALH